MSSIVHIPRLLKMGNLRWNLPPPHLSTSCPVSLFYPKKTQERPHVLLTLPHCLPKLNIFYIYLSLYQLYQVQTCFVATRPITTLFCTHMFDAYCTTGTDSAPVLSTSIIFVSTQYITPSALQHSFACTCLMHIGPDASHQYNCVYLFRRMIDLLRNFVNGPTKILCSNAFMHHRALY